MSNLDTFMIHTIKTMGEQMNQRKFTRQRIDPKVAAERANRGAEAIERELRRRASRRAFITLSLVVASIIGAWVFAAWRAGA